MSEEAIWILKEDRHDLMENWFKYRQAQVRQFLDRVLSLAYGGIEGAVTPDDVLQQIAQLRRQATYVGLLANKAFKDRESNWNADDTRPLRLGAEQAIGIMEDDINEIAKIHTLISQVVSKTDSLASGPLST